MGKWKIRKTSIFRRQYDNIGHERMVLADKAIAELVDSDNPAVLGKYKRKIRASSYEIGRTDRLLYSLDYGRREITLLYVGDHKAVYGRD